MDDASAKEKAKSQENEKEQDTTGSAGGKGSQKTTGSPRSPKAKGKAPAGKTGSAQSAVSSAKSVTKKGEKTSAKAGPRAPSPKGSAAKGKGAKGGKKKQEEEKPDTSGAQENDDALPEGVIAIFLASKTQEIFECRGDEDVTAENPLKLIKKEDILKDLFNRAAVCDFQPYKQIIQDYPADEILIGYDADFKYGQNFFMATTEEAKEKLLHPPVLTEEGVEIQEHGEEEAVVYKYIPPEPKDWVSQGSEREVEEESVKETRQK